jgi:hypothetical protein
MQTIFPVNVASKLATANSDWLLYTWKDWLLIGLSIAVLLIYEGVFLFVYHVSPHHCTLHRNISARKYAKLPNLHFLVQKLTLYLSERRWVESLLKKKGAEILVVQALRNGIIAANFFAGASFTIAIFVIGYVFLVKSSYKHARDHLYGVLEIRFWFSTSYDPICSRLSADTIDSH